MAGVSTSAISHYERNVSNPSIQMAFKISECLNESVERLWGKEYKGEKAVDNSHNICYPFKDMKYKNRLKYFREQAGLTQKELAAKVGLSLNMISCCERGINVPRIAMAKKICKVLNVKLDDIWGNGE